MFADLFNRNIYLAKLETEVPVVSKLSRDSTHCSGELQKILTNEGQSYDIEESSFVAQMTSKLIDREIEMLEKQTRNTNPQGFGEGRIGPGTFLHQGVLTGNH